MMDGSKQVKHTLACWQVTVISREICKSSYMDRLTLAYKIGLATVIVIVFEFEILISRNVRFSQFKARHLESVFVCGFNGLNRFMSPTRPHCCVEQS